MVTTAFMLRAYLSRNDQAMEVTTNTVELADWVFTRCGAVNKPLLMVMPSVRNGRICRCWAILLCKTVS